MEPGNSENGNKNKGQFYLPQWAWLISNPNITTAISGRRDWKSILSRAFILTPSLSNFVHPWSLPQSLSFLLYNQYFRKKSRRLNWHSRLGRLQKNTIMITFLRNLYFLFKLTTHHIIKIIIIIAHCISLKKKY